MGAIQIRGPIPGPRSIELTERRARAVAPGVSTLHPVFVERASGATVTDVDGNTFLDFTGGIGVMNVGHARPEVVAAVAEQAARITHACFQVAGYEQYVALAETLCRIAPGAGPKKVFLCSTGAEAVENAVKIARAHTRRPGILCFEHAFHGRTLLGMTLTGKVAPYKAGFGPFAPEVYRLPYPYTYRHGRWTDIERSLKTMVAPTDLAAVVIEPVLGEGGFVVAPQEFLAELRAFCDRHGIVLVADEVQTGFGRTGRMFACERLGLDPDLVTMAKSMAGGMPLGAVVGRASIVDSVGPGGLGGTYAGNPVACAAAIATIAVYERDDVPPRADALGARVHERMLALKETVPLIGDVRGLGAMQAIELVRDRATKEPADTETRDVVARARQAGLLLLSAGSYGNVIRFLFPLTIGDGELDEGLAVVERVLARQ
ncbi:MAG: 4-aminobutyrate--2-oxoglutarate transaminase [Deltaproteobacteria bacterium]|nr:4-aminobutyrate--2-oxoglutarate transaminase [Deltaproteobacteria bacterium]